MPDLLTQLGISCNGPYVDNWRVSYEGKDAGIPAFVLLTGFDWKRKEHAVTNGKRLDVDVFLKCNYREFPVHVWDLESLANTAYKGIHEKGYILFVYDPQKASYSLVVPEQNYSRKTILSRFASPPDEQMFTRDQFWLPVVRDKKDSKRLVPYKKKPIPAGHIKVSVFYQPEFRYAVLRQFIKERGLLSSAVKDCAVFHLPPSFFEQQVYRRGSSHHLRKSFEGVLQMYYPPSGAVLNTFVRGEAQARYQSELKNSKGRNLMLSATSAELNPTEEQKKRWKPLLLSDKEKWKLIEQHRALDYVMDGISK